MGGARSRFASPVLPGTGASVSGLARYTLVAFTLLTPLAARRGEPAGAPVTDPVRPIALDTLRVVDDAGRTVSLARPARRIVSLVPALTETLYAIGAGDRLVGRTRYDRHPSAVRSVPSVGDGIRPSAEAIRALAPDLVILYAGPDNRGVADQLGRVGLRTLAVRHDSLEDLARNARRLGRLTGCTPGAAALLARIERDLARVREATRATPERTVYYEVWWAPPITVGAGSYLDALLELAGARNVFGDLEAASPQVSLEAIVARDPDLLLWPVDAGSSGDRVAPAARPGWGILRAVRAGAVRRLDGDLVHRLGPRVGEAALELALAVHPELAASPAAGRARAAAAARRPAPGACEGGA